MKPAFVSHPKDFLTRWGRNVFVGLWLTGALLLGARATGALLFSGWIAAGVVLALAGSIAVAVMCQRCGIFARPLNRVPRATGRVGLTFDDGPDPRFTPRVLELLARHGQRATFFVVGKKAKEHPHLLQRMVQEGHEVANHTTDHPWHLALWPTGRVIRDLNLASQWIEDACGQRPRFFRPPAAILSPAVELAAQRARLTLVGFSTRSGDGSSMVSQPRVWRRLVRGLVPGAILVLHDSRGAPEAPVSLSLLPDLLQELSRRGMCSVTLSELLQQDTERR